jgi:uncharacterized protein YrrD
MQLKPDIPVLTGGGTEIVGHIDQIVVNPQTNEPTHFVVRKGFLLNEDKVIPMSLVGKLREDRVVLQDGFEDLESLPNFDESRFAPLDEHALTMR